jgi:hypothetical protein
VARKEEKKITHCYNVQNSTQSGVSLGAETKLSQTQGPVDMHETIHDTSVVFPQQHTNTRGIRSWVLIMVASPLFELKPTMV